ncbi:hypothetical protein STSP2_02825 [Anaerohalosphaera lusitana]|uniref:Glycosyltransferase RgtA/B/C/D-like domain-containing protein n=1 Tax=Anaerohalosphaera lusitana TaxID=1936003 RepID=A0A1U9NNY9_9BACT|nr:glycosyltransferase family 39 protein [Anaerohalosphaera lusitana]AQT69631.1 hypothetical protein STSP2_02825 [Anaerohalosphaera lusitana]
MGRNKSRRRNRVKGSEPKVQTQGMKNRDIPVWAWAVIALILAGIPFSMGKYLELSTPGPFDSGAYVYSAAHLLDGAKLGVDEMSSARPGTLLVNVIGVALFGYNDTGPKILQGIFQVLAFAMMFYTLWRVFGGLAAVFGVFVASFYLSAPILAKFGNVKEQYMIALMIAAACCFVLRRYGGGWWLMLVCGFFAMGSYYFKPTGLSVSAAVWLWLVGGAVIGHINWLKAVKELGLFAAGGAAGLVPFLLLYVWQGQAGLFFEREIPFGRVELAVMLTVAVFVVHQLIVCRGHIVAGVRSGVRQIHKPVWIFAGVGVLIGLIVLTSFYVYFDKTHVADGRVYAQGEGFYYLLDVPFIGAVANVVYSVEGTLHRGLGLGSYVGSSRAVRSFSEQAEFVLRFYGVLILPVLMGILTGAAAAVRRFVKSFTFETRDAVAVFLFVWWVGDMALLWLSPRPYEQYFLPLNASAAMCGGYLVWRHWGLLAGGRKGVWVGSGAVALVAMLVMITPVFAGVRKSPWTGNDYGGERRRGYLTKLEQLGEQKRRGGVSAWQQVGRYIRQNSDEDAEMYVWGWYPGIYVEAQRFSPARSAFEGNMHVMSPSRLQQEVSQLIEQFKEDPPQFIVDSRKRHFPNDRPPLELWPVTKKGLLPKRSDVVERFETEYSRFLAEQIEEQEAERFEVMGAFRKYVRENYKPVKTFGPHVLFERTKG